MGDFYKFVYNSFVDPGKMVSTTSSVSEVDFRNNYWGTTDPYVIEDKILHDFDDLSRGVVLYNPWLPAPHPNTPTL